MSAERTERPTPRRRHDARKRGQVARSPDLSAAAVLVGIAALLRWWGPYASNQLATMMRMSLSDLASGELTTGRLQQLGYSAGMTLALVVGPIAATALVLGMTSSIAQTGLMFSTAALKPDFNRLNPSAGIKRILSRRGAFETFKALIKMAVVIGFSYPVVQTAIQRFAQLTGSDPLQFGRVLGDTVGQLALRGTGAFLLLALLDFAFQRWDLEKKLKMTRQEVREDLKQTEGNPELKGRIRRLQRRLARGRMMSAVPQATAILTNPTHLAVAIRFDARTMSAPVVVAKGSGHVAERIKSIGRAHSVPVIENKPLARALYQMGEVGMEIPVLLYEAVADVIAYIYRLRTR